jgi:hypothetical protein
VPRILGVPPTDLPGLDTPDLERPKSHTDADSRGGMLLIAGSWGPRLPGKSITPGAARSVVAARAARCSYLGSTASRPMARLSQPHPGASDPSPLRPSPEDNRERQNVHKRH